MHFSPDCSCPLYSTVKCIVEEPTSTSVGTNLYPHMLILRVARALDELSSVHAMRGQRAYPHAGRFALLHRGVL